MARFAIMPFPWVSIPAAAPIGLCAVAAVLWLAVCGGAGFSHKHTGGRAWSACLALGGFALLCAAVAGMNEASTTLTLPSPLSFGLVGVTFRVDPLGAYFLLVIALISLPVALYLPDYMEKLQRQVDMRVFFGALGLLLLSMSGVVLAANALTFLVAWELMALSSFLLVATNHQLRATRQAALIYLGSTRISSAFVAGGFLWAHALSGSWVFQDWRFSGVAAAGPGLLLLVGLGIKAGMWPFHLWLPIAHPAAPAPVSALMSGVMVKVAIYMMIRLFLLEPAFSHPILGYTLLVLGAISAFWGILFAMLERDLKRLLAYSTVENVGLILIAVGGAIVALDLRLPVVATMACGAALFHVLNHAMFKSLLFLGAGAVDYRCHTRDLDQLGGLARWMPWTFGLFTFGAAAICGFPPLNGFASEWLLYQASLHLAGSGAAPLLRFFALLMVGWIALVGALAVACFTRVVGVAFQGRPRSREAEHAREAPNRMLLAQALLAGGCVLLGVGAPCVLGWLQPIAHFQGAGPAALSGAWTVPVGTVALLLFCTLGSGWLWLAEASRRGRVRRYVTWDCGFGDLSLRMQSTAASFGQPIARMFGVLFRYTVRSRIEDVDGRLFPQEIVVESQSESLLETRMYAPVLRSMDRAGSWIARMQAGSVHQYLLTMFLTLIILLVVGGRHR